MAEDSGELACNGAVYVFDDVEVRGEENVEVALMDLLYAVRSFYGEY